VGVIRRLNKGKKEVLGKYETTNRKILFRERSPSTPTTMMNAFAFLSPFLLFFFFFFIISPSLSPLIIIDITLVAINHMNNNNKKSLLCFFSSI
jgi:hypothetical protein